MTRPKTVDGLGLIGLALDGARTLRAMCPYVEFTSGRRSRGEQAGAMASNVLSNRDWIQQTYRESRASVACQAWVDSHEKTLTLAGIADGLRRVLEGLTDLELGELSRHPAGLAFDVRPMPGARGERIKTVIRSLPGLDKFLEKEGGLVRWHAQFNARVSTLEPRRES